jgi:hypothetical protein
MPFISLRPHCRLPRATTSYLHTPFHLFHISRLWQKGNILHSPQCHSIHQRIHESFPRLPLRYLIGRNPCPERSFLSHIRAFVATISILVLHSPPGFHRQPRISLTSWRTMGAALSTTLSTTSIALLALVRPYLFYLLAF